MFDQTSKTPFVVIVKNNSQSFTGKSSVHPPRKLSVDIAKCGIFHENRMFFGVMFLKEDHCGMLCFHGVYIFRKTYDKRLVFSAPDNRGKNVLENTLLNLVYPVQEN